MKKLYLLLLLLAAAACFAQNARYDAPVQSGATIQVCSDPANGVPCSNYATTYNSAGTACANSAQDTPQPQPSPCQAGVDNRGYMGFWAPSGTYDYTYCVAGSCAGPFVVTLGAAAGSGTTINPTNGLIPVRSNSTTFIDSPLSVSGPVLGSTDAIQVTNGSLSELNGFRAELIGNAQAVSATYQSEYACLPSNGTLGSPTAVSAGQVMCGFSSGGYANGAYTQSPQTALFMYAGENWTGTNQGTFVQLESTPNTTTVPETQLLIDHLGNIELGAPVPTALGLPSGALYTQVNGATGALSTPKLNQIATGNFGGTCAMSSATTCTITLGAAYTTPVCIASQQSSGTVIAAECSVSSTTLTITAAASNSATWGAIVFGNPN